MPLSATNFISKGPVMHADMLQFFNLFTGVMVDQPVTFSNVLNVGGNQGNTTVPFKLYGAVGQTTHLIDLYLDRTQAQPSFGFSALGTFGWGPGGTAPIDTSLSRIGTQGHASDTPGLLITPTLEVGGNIIVDGSITFPSGAAIADGGSGTVNIGTNLAVQTNLYVGFDHLQYIHEVAPGSQLGIDPVLLIHGANALAYGLTAGNAILQVRGLDVPDVVGSWTTCFSAIASATNWTQFNVKFEKITAGVGWPGVALLLDYDVDNGGNAGGRIAMMSGMIGISGVPTVANANTLQVFGSAWVSTNLTVAAGLWAHTSSTIGNRRGNPGNLMLLVSGVDNAGDADALFVENAAGTRLLEARNDGWVFTSPMVQISTIPHQFQVQSFGGTTNALVLTPATNTGFFMHNAGIGFWNDTDPQGGGSPSFRVIEPSSRPAATYGGGELHIGIRIFADGDITSGTNMHAISFMTTSDPNLKGNPTLFSDTACMARVRGALPVYQYTLPPPTYPGYPQPNSLAMGFMAPDMQANSPEFVAVDATSTPVSVVYGQITSLLWGALRNLDVRCQQHGI